jgi:hypothetical protein
MNLWTRFESALRLILCIGFMLSSVETTSAEEPLPGLNVEETEAVTESVDRALDWLAKKQQPDGSFPGPMGGQPAITCLTVLAFASAGHLPGEGEHGEQLERAVRYSLKCEITPGFFCAIKPAGVWQYNQSSHTGYYSQAIAGLMFAEVGGQLKGKLAEDVSAAVERALEQTKNVQFLSIPGRQQDEGGWGYPVENPDSNSATDLSITAWQITFLRSAKNAGYDVDQQLIDAAKKYVKGLFEPRRGTFTYDHVFITRGMAGAGIMSLSLLGEHDTEEANTAARWLQRHPFNNYGELVGNKRDRFHYSVYYCTQAMYQRGGKEWEQFYPQVAQLLVNNQLPNGSWLPGGHERIFGQAYVTAMSVLALTPSYAMLPIHQR